MSRRKVHFSVPIHQIEYLEKESEDTDDHPYSSLYWAHVAADRDRFKKRIEHISGIISKVFDPEFRQQIYQERFENFSPTTNEINSTITENTNQENTSLETVTNISQTTDSLLSSSLSSSQSLTPVKQSASPITNCNNEIQAAPNQVVSNQKDENPT